MSIGNLHNRPALSDLSDEMRDIVHNACDAMEYLQQQVADTVGHLILEMPKPEGKNPADIQVEWELKLHGDMLSAGAKVLSAFIIAQALRTAARPAEGAGECEVL